MRGIALVVMAMDHIPHCSLACLFNAFGPIGFFSANSIFFFVSGIASGLAYGSTRITRGTWAAVCRACQRVRTIYLVQIGLFILVAIAGLNSTAFQHHYAHFYQDPLEGTLLGLVFLYQFQFLDILPLYVFLLLITPLAIVAYQSGKTWMVLAPSALLWGLSQFRMPPLPSNQDGPLFFLNPFSFQLVFMAGLYFGCRRRSPGAPEPAVLRSRTLLTVSAWLCAGFLILRQIYVFYPQLVSAEISHAASLLDLKTQGPLRLLNFAAWAYLVWRINSRLPEWAFTNKVSQWLALLGRHSLQVFAWTVILGIGFQIFVPIHVSRLGGVTETLFTLATLALPAWLHAAYQRSRQEVTPPIFSTEFLQLRVDPS